MDGAAEGRSLSAYDLLSPVMTAIEDLCRRSYGLICIRSRRIIPDLCIIQSRDGEHGPRDQLCLKAADGGDIQGVYIISPVQGIKNIRKLPGEIA